MADKVTIFNRALYLLKKQRITNPDNSVELSDIYESVVDDVLYDHPWNFAKFFASLAKETTAASWKYTYSYVLPTEPWCLRVRELEDHAIKWEVVGNRKLVTDEGPPLKIAYTGRVSDETRFSPGFVTALSIRLAIEGGPKIGGVTARQVDALQKRYDGLLALGRSADGQEGHYLEVEAEDYLDARV